MHQCKPAVNSHHHWLSFQVSERTVTSAWTQPEATQTHHSFLDEELRPLQGTGHVLTQPLALVLLQHLAVEGAHLQCKHLLNQSEFVEIIIY